jgi:hypothetical protein
MWVGRSAAPVEIAPIDRIKPKRQRTRRRRVLEGLVREIQEPYIQAMYLPEHTTFIVCTVGLLPSAADWE